MNFTPTAAQLEWQERARRMAEGVMAPGAANADDLRVFQRAALDHLRREGFLSLAVPDWHGGRWVDHVTYAGEVDAYIVRADQEDGAAMNFAVHARDNPGVRVEERWDGMGLRASSTNDVIFEECFVSQEDLLGVCPDPEPLCFQPTAGF